MSLIATFSSKGRQRNWERRRVIKTFDLCSTLIRAQNTFSPLPSSVHWRCSSSRRSYLFFPYTWLQSMATCIFCSRLFLEFSKINMGFLGAVLDLRISASVLGRYWVYFSAELYQIDWWRGSWTAMEAWPNLNTVSLFWYWELCSCPLGFSGTLGQQNIKITTFCPSSGLHFLAAGW